MLLLRTQLNWMIYKTAEYNGFRLGTSINELNPANRGTGDTLQSVHAVNIYIFSILIVLFLFIIRHDRKKKKITNA